MHLRSCVTTSPGAICKNADFWLVAKIAIISCQSRENHYKHQIPDSEVVKY